MKARSLSLLFLAGLVCPSPGQNQRQGPPQGPPPDPIAMTLDRDRDGELSRAEIRRAVRALMRLDENDDGQLSEEELRPEPPRPRRRRRGEENEQGPPPQPPASPLFSALDTDESGDLSAQELEAAVASLMTLDTDDNGRLSADESGIQQLAGPNGPGGRGPGRGGPPPGRPRR